MMETLFLHPPSLEGFDGGAGSRYQARREIRAFWYPSWLAQPAALVRAVAWSTRHPRASGLRTFCRSRATTSCWSCIPPARPSPRTCGWPRPCGSGTQARDRPDRRQGGGRPRGQPRRRVLPVPARAAGGGALKRQLIVTADDFGLDPAANEAVEQAATRGILTAASLMVAAPAAADAVARARRLPGLAVGLHLVLVDGAPALPPELIPDLVGPDGRFGTNMVRAGVGFFFRAGVRRQLAAEIRAQFEAFAATGLTLDHADAHKHMHVHPTVARLLIEIGAEFGLGAVRVPYEPRALLPGPRAPLASRLGALGLGVWTGRLRRRLHRAGLCTNERVFGLAWSGAMTEERVLPLIEALPEGVSEIYFHPATGRTPALVEAMPGYRHVEELQALCSPRVRDAIARAGITLTTFGRIGLASAADLA